ncbi:uncharacterized protein C8A04DRAFT_31030 [Dichotomopilus funicola]|uniref:Transmembrane protein n=1 Tax=Dichotomopilus funicola TaxID=1934379 RepID=A0AAN6UYI4_9PEZI|nr:hypothetical protein C8A04DRAFT_31030 [Dichotomopilus funicola]
MKLLLLTLLSLLSLTTAFVLPNPLNAALNLATRDPHSTRTSNEHDHGEVHRRKWRKCKYNCNNYYHNNNNNHHNAGVVVGPSMGMGVGVVVVGIMGVWVGV